MNVRALDEAERTRLAQAWLAARYFVRLEGQEWLFSIGEPASAVERRVPAPSYVFLTAWNPHGQQASTAGNEAADRRLQQELRLAGRACHPALGCDSHGGMIEHGWLIENLDVTEAEDLARRFGQGGLLHWRQGEPVRLRMLWPAPLAAPVHPCLDWAGSG